MPPSEFYRVVDDSMFLVICRYIKLTHYILARIDWLAERLAKAFLTNVWQDKDISDSLLSNQGSPFTSKF